MLETRHENQTLDQVGFPCPASWVAEVESVACANCGLGCENEPFLPA
jgi:hypothetical protein